MRRRRARRTEIVEISGMGWEGCWLSAVDEDRSGVFYSLVLVPGDREPGRGSGLPVLSDAAGTGTASCSLDERLPLGTVPDPASLLICVQFLDCH